METESSYLKRDVQCGMICSKVKPIHGNVPVPKDFGRIFNVRFSGSDPPQHPQNSVSHNCGEVQCTQMQHVKGAHDLWN